MNIFARELTALLEKHGKQLGSLYGLRDSTFYLIPNKVTRLKRSLTEDITATLTPEELVTLAEWLQVDQDGEEMRRLRAALIAEGVRHLAGGRMSRDAGNRLGELTFRMLLDKEPYGLATFRDELLEGIR